MSFPSARSLKACVFPSARGPKRCGMLSPARCPKAYGIFAWRVARRRVARYPHCVTRSRVIRTVFLRGPETCGMCSSRRAARRHVVYFPRGVARRRAASCPWRVAKGVYACGMLSQRLAQRRRVCFPWRMARRHVACAVYRVARKRISPVRGSKARGMFPQRVARRRAACSLRAWSMRDHGNIMLFRTVRLNRFCICGQGS